MLENYTTSTVFKAMFMLCRKSFLKFHIRTLFNFRNIRNLHFTFWALCSSFVSLYTRTTLIACRFLYYFCFEFYFTGLGGCHIFFKVYGYWGTPSLLKSCVVYVRYQYMLLPSPFVYRKWYVGWLLTLPQTI